MKVDSKTPDKLNKIKGEVFLEKNLSFTSAFTKSILILGYESDAVEQALLTGSHKGNTSKCISCVVLNMRENGHLPICMHHNLMRDTICIETKILGILESIIMKLFSLQLLVGRKVILSCTSSLISFSSNRFNIFHIIFLTHLLILTLPYHSNLCTLQCPGG